MVRVADKYVWSDNVHETPLIEAHSKIKHSIIDDYIRSYLKVVVNPITSHVKLFIVDGFCGGGLYNDEGQPHLGTPLIILNALKESIAEIAADRVAQNIQRELFVECTVYFIDRDKNAIDVLKKTSASHVLVPPGLPLTIKTHFLNDEFLNVYRNILGEIKQSKAIFILDPCGYSEAPLPVIKEIMQTGERREIIWTFMIQNMLTYANDKSKALVNSGYEGLLNLFKDDEKPTDFNLQKSVYDTILKEIGTSFFTPFAIKNPRGWHYWLIHLAWHYRASEVMKEVEHRHAQKREHYGRAGLSMMAAEGDRPYMFGDDDVRRGKVALYDDIPRFLSEGNENEMSFDSFMKQTYNQTPLKSETIKEVLSSHKEIEIITSAQAIRRSYKRIHQSDIIRVKRQSFFDFGSEQRT